MGPIFFPTKMSIYIEEEKTKKKRKDIILKVGKNQQFAVRKEGHLKNSYWIEIQKSDKENLTYTETL